MWLWASYESQLLLGFMRGSTVTMEGPVCMTSRHWGPSLQPHPFWVSSHSLGPWILLRLPLPFRVKSAPPWLHWISHSSFEIHRILHPSPEPPWPFPPPCPCPTPHMADACLSCPLSSMAPPWRNLPELCCFSLWSASWLCSHPPLPLPGPPSVSHLFLLLPAALPEAGDSPHSPFPSQQPGFHRDTRPRSFWMRKSFEAQGGAVS